MQATVQWIGVRPEKKAPMTFPTEVLADAASGLTGDRASKSNRQVTLISTERLAAVAQKLGRAQLDPALTRRNILITGMDFNLPVGTHLHIGDAILEITGPCLPCSRMNETMGEGGRLAMAEAEAGGLTTRVVKPGTVAIGDRVLLAALTEQ